MPIDNLLVVILSAFIALVAVAALAWFLRSSGGRRRDAVPAAAAPVMAPAALPVQAAVDGALVAVITAAIAAATGSPASAIRIASVQAAGFNTPAWSYVDRINRGARGRR